MAASNYIDLQSLASQLPSGCAGLVYGNPPHVSDAIELLAEAWESIQPNSVASCWKRAKQAPSDISGPEEYIQCAQAEMLHR